MQTSDFHSATHRTIDELRQALAEVRASPRDRGTLHLIVRRPAVGTREVLADGDLDPAGGLVGDGWHARPCPRTPDRAPHPDMQLTLMNVRAIRAISPDTSRWPLAGDQLFVDFDLTADHLPPGMRLHVAPAAAPTAGGAVELEITSQPHTGCGKFVERFGVDAMAWVNSPEGRALNLRGIYARVVQGGRIQRGDVVSKLR